MKGFDKTKQFSQNADNHFFRSMHQHNGDGDNPKSPYIDWDYSENKFFEIEKKWTEIVSTLGSCDQARMHIRRCIIVLEFIQQSSDKDISPVTLESLGRITREILDLVRSIKFNGENPLVEAQQPAVISLKLKKELREESGFYMLEMIEGTNIQQLISNLGIKISTVLHTLNIFTSGYNH